MAINVQSMTPLFQVFDMQTSLDFYCGELGFKLIHKAGPSEDIGWVMLKLNETYLMLNTQYELQDRPPVQNRQKTEAHQDTCLYFMCADADDVYEHIIQIGIEANKPTVANYGMKQFYINDPDGYHIYFQSAVQ